jgi:O-antigen/teichoic acid export membrane protein
VHNLKSFVKSLTGLSTLSIISAIATYVFIAIVARTLGSDHFGQFTFVWSLIYTFSGSIFAAIEPELTRAMISNQWRHGRQVAVAAFSLIFLLFLAIVFLGVFQVRTPTQGYIPLYISVLVITAMLIQVIARSSFAASSRRVIYGFVSLSDALLRLFLIATVLISGVNGTVSMFLILIMMSSSVVAIVVCRSASKNVSCLLSEQNSSITRHADQRFNLAHLFLGTIAMTGFISGIPLVVSIFTNISTQEVGILSAALIVARVPMLLTMGFESVLVQKFHERISSKELAKKVASFLLGISLIFGALGFFLGGLVGPWLVQIVAGTEYEIPAIQMSLLSCSIGLFIGSSFLTSLCIALNRHKGVSLSWVSSFLCFLLTISIWGDSSLFISQALASALFICAYLLYLSSIKESDLSRRENQHG